MMNNRLIPMLVRRLLYPARSAPVGEIGTGFCVDAAQIYHAGSEANDAYIAGAVSSRNINRARVHVAGAEAAGVC